MSNPIEKNRILKPYKTNIKAIISNSIKCFFIKGGVGCIYDQ
ncbi:unnamed protein product [Paramecium octaurelia]|uniref:Uncharacterized protein n=1 Tax=Paramecium octaurelia TaxID=43137 RepID=A0A8S1VJE0_PAROT|nr:unnamed protein product [Paramecium octaurelia]